MTYTLPFTIESKNGERLTFVRMEGQRLIVEGFVAPGAGPAMHTHLLQDEAITIVSGRVGYQILGQEPVYGGPGTTAFFKRGTPHSFWNDGTDELHLTGWIDSADNVIFFLSTLYDAMNRGSNRQPELFDSAFLLRRYRREYEMPAMPGFVRHIVMPLVYWTGNLLGKYRKFENAPLPL